MWTSISAPRAVHDLSLAGLYPAGPTDATARSPIGDLSGRSTGAAGSASGYVLLLPLAPFLVAPPRLPFFALAPPSDFADFIALPTAFLVNILTIVFTTTFPIPPILLAPLLC